MRLSVYKSDDDYYPQLRMKTRAEWHELGDQIAKVERTYVDIIPPDKFVTLRLDGAGFSSKVKYLRRMGIIEEKGISNTFASFMENVTLSLCKKFVASHAHTHSDEIVLILKQPSLLVESPQYVYGGRTLKLLTLASGHASSLFTKFVVESEEWREKENKSDKATTTFEFDCRIGVWDTFEDAFNLILWRSYDAIINGITDIVFHSEGARKIVDLSTKEKILWLKQHDVSINLHRVYGTFFSRKKVSMKTINRKTMEEVVVERRIYEKEVRNVIEMMNDGTILFPKT